MTLVRQWKSDCQDLSLTLVTKRNDPNYAQVTGHIPVDLARRFGIYCASKQISKSEGLEKAVETLLAQEPEFSAHETPKPPSTLTELVRDNYFALMNAGEISHSRLEDLAFGHKPTTTEIATIASNLDIPKERVVELSDRTFPTKEQAK
jgi:hypothetical protein